MQLGEWKLYEEYIYATQQSYDTLYAHSDCYVANGVHENSATTACKFVILGLWCVMIPLRERLRSSLLRVCGMESHTLIKLLGFFRYIMALALLFYFQSQRLELDSEATHGARKS